jgi:hypothetical protein
MSIGPLPPVITSAAGAPLAQTQGPEVERAQHASSVAQQQAQGQQKAETAAGIGEADGADHQTGERDADGRLPWQRRRNRAGQPGAAARRDIPAAEGPPSSPPPEPEPPPSPKDPSGQSGSLLDLAG